MRFGIMDMQIGALIPPGLTPENAAAHLAGFDHAAQVRDLARRGFRLIELGGDLALFFPQSFAEPAVAALAGARADLDLTYTVHLPLWSLEPASPLDPVRRAAVQVIADIIRATRCLEPAAYVFHATGPLVAEFCQMPLPGLARDLLMRQFQAYAYASVAAVLAETGLPSRLLAIETIDFPFDLTLELAGALDTSVCLDVGHVLAGFAGQVDLFDALEQALPRLGEIHLHDAPWYGRTGRPAYGQDHQALGKGDLDTGRLLDRLQAAHYDGPIIFELMVPEAEASLEILRTQRPALVPG